MRPSLKEHELDYAGDVFGFVYDEHYGAPQGCFRVYLEDDENWHEELVFNHLFLGDLKKLVKRMEDRLNEVATT